MKRTKQGQQIYDLILSSNGHMTAEKNAKKLNLKNKIWKLV